MSLKLPKVYETINEAEQMELMGGGINLSMNYNFTKRPYCSRSAFTYIYNCKWKNISEEALKKELYAHAYVYYKWGFLENIPLASSIYEDASDGIYIEDAEDSRQWVFDIIWNFNM